MEKGADGFETLLASAVQCAMELQEDSELTTGVDETDSDGGSDGYEDSQATGHHSEHALNTVHDAGTYNSPCGYCHSGAPSSCAHGASRSRQ